jgi:hypothetical protein
MRQSLLRFAVVAALLLAAPAWAATSFQPGDPRVALYTNQAFSDGEFLFQMQSDGNLVLYRYGDGTPTAAWASNTQWQCVRCLGVYQGDGNLVVYNTDNWQALFASNTVGSDTMWFNAGIVPNQSLLIYLPGGNLIYPPPPPPPAPPQTTVPQYVQDAINRGLCRLYSANQVLCGNLLISF